MRPGDCEEAATRASEAFSGDSGFAHFWEEEGWPVSTARRPLLGLGDYEPTRSVWDVYLCYDPGVEWVHLVPPTPTQWAHQLEPDPGVGDRLALNTVSRWLAGPAHSCRSAQITLAPAGASGGSLAC
jgi:hypothetical protein